MNDRHDEPGELPETGAQAHPDATAPTAGAPVAGYCYQRGQRIGVYTLRDPLERGGFGEVWRAERRHPNMTAAVKLVRPDRADAASIARFSAECQALALLDHPGIARIHDAGVTEDGTPYLAMEYVHGVSLGEFCDREKLPIRGRLELMARIADAVHHAHTQGIIHRDLKPENILVSIHEDGEPQARIVDFGIAKAVNKNVRLTDMTITHDLHTMIGTPAYMSPEQLESTQLGVDTRTDIYALGVILYELISGVVPLSDKPGDGGLEQMLRLVRSERPEPASRFAACSREERATIAMRRGELHPEQLDALLGSRLRHLAMKAMRPERHKRFTSAAAMAQDIRHYLADEDYAEAAAEPRLDRLRRSVRRHRGAYGAGAGLVLLLVGGVVATSFGLHRARLAESAALAAEARSRDDAERARLAEAAALDRVHELRQVAAFQRAQLSSIDPGLMGAQIRADLLSEVRAAASRRGLGEDEAGELLAAAERVVGHINPTNLAMRTLERSVFRQTIEAIEEGFGAQPLLHAQLLEATAATMRDAGLLESAREAQARAVALYQRFEGAESRAAFQARQQGAGMLASAGQLEAAERELRRLMEAVERAFGASDPVSLWTRTSLGDVLDRLGRPGEAQAQALAVLELAGREGADDDEPARLAAGVLASALAAQGRHAEAEPYARDAMLRAERAFGESHPRTLSAANNLASVLQALGRAEEAETLYRRAHEGQRRRLGDGHPSTLTTATNLAAILRATGRVDEARPLYEAALAGRRAALGPDHPDTLQSLNNVGVLLLESLRQPDEAEGYLREAYEGRRRTLGPTHPGTLASRINLGVLHRERGSLDEAERAFVEAFEGFRDTLGPGHPSTLAAALNLAGVYKARRQPRARARRCWNLCWTRPARAWASITRRPSA